MYGKHFSAMYEGSMMGAGPVVFAVWGYVISKAVDGQVELNPKLISVLIGTEPESIEAAIEYLCSEDRNSRSKKNDGRRLVKIGQFSYEVTTHEDYRNMRSEEDRRQYNRDKKREERARNVKNVKNVNDMSSMSRMSRMSANTEAEAEAEAEAETNKTKRSVCNGQPYSGDFEKFWNAFPKQRRTKKKDAFQSWRKVIQNVDAARLIDRACEYAKSKNGLSEYAVMPSVWLNSGMYDDSIEAWGGVATEKCSTPKPVVMCQALMDHTGGNFVMNHNYDQYIDDNGNIIPFKG